MAGYADLPSTLGSLAYSTGQGQRGERMLDRRNRRYEFLSNLGLQQEQLDLQKRQLDRAEQARQDEMKFKSLSLQEQSRQSDLDRMASLQRQQMYTDSLGNRFALPPVPEVPASVQKLIAEGKAEFSPAQRKQLSQLMLARSTALANPEYNQNQRIRAIQMIDGKIRMIYANPTANIPLKSYTLQEVMQDNTTVTPDGKWFGFRDPSTGKVQYRPNKTDEELQMEKDKELANWLTNAIKMKESSDIDPDILEQDKDYQRMKQQYFALVNKYLPNQSTQDNFVWGSQQQPEQQKFSVWGAMYGGIPSGLPSYQPSPVPTSQQPVMPPGAAGKSPTPTPQPTQGQPQQSRTVRTEYVKSLVARIRKRSDLDNPDIESQFNNMTPEEQKIFADEMKARGLI